MPVDLHKQYFNCSITEEIINNLLQINNINLSIYSYNNWVMVKTVTLQEVTPAQSWLIDLNYKSDFNFFEQKLHR